MSIIPNLGSVTTSTAGGRALRVKIAESSGSGNLILGSDDGTVNGNLLPFVNNQKEQILATDDREQEIFYEDFGNKNQRIVKIEYTSLRFPLIKAVKDIQYSLVGTKYRRDKIIWSVQNV